MTGQDQALPCKAHGGAHRYTICQECDAQYCPRMWQSCPRCATGAQVVTQATFFNERVKARARAQAHVARQRARIARELHKLSELADQYDLTLPSGELVSAFLSTIAHDLETSKETE